MGKFKGISLLDVEDILKRARAAGFPEIQLNYIAGLDSLTELAAGFSRLVEASLVDSVGISTFVAFTPSQRSLRHVDAHSLGYYQGISRILRGLDIPVYHPESFDMRLAHSLSMRKVPT
jgi:hypothetical protein